MRVHYKPICCGDDGELPSRSRKIIYKELLLRYSNSIIIFVAAILIFSLYLLGLLAYVTEGNFDSYQHPAEIVNLRGIIELLDEQHSINQRENLMIGENEVDFHTIEEGLKSINATRLIQLEDINHNVVKPSTQFTNYSFLIDIKPNCLSQWGTNQLRSTLLPHVGYTSRMTDKLSIIIVVKSAVNNYVRRDAIRKSWYLNEIYKDIFLFKTVFMVGNCHESNRKPYRSENQVKTSALWSPQDCNVRINEEAKTHGDIIQSSHIDSYYNITIKTFMTLKWLNEKCPSDFTLTLDDDYVFEVENFINYLYNISSIYQNRAPMNLESKILSSNSQIKLETLRQMSQQFIWAGYLRNFVHPLRMVFSKWYISQKEYVYNKYPPFITGGAVLMSFKTVKYFYYATYFTEAFKFDDVYMGMIAYKLDITALHSEEFMCSLESYMELNPIHPNATKCIGVHDIDAHKLVELWESRKIASRTYNLTYRNS